VSDDDDDDDNNTVDSSRKNLRGSFGVKAKPRRVPSQSSDSTGTTHHSSAHSMDSNTPISHPDDRPIKGTASSSSTPIKNKQKTANDIQHANAAKRVMESTPELQDLQGLLLSTTLKSWTDRRDNMSRLTDVILQHHKVLQDANKLSSCIDSLLDRLEDGSVKVIFLPCLLSLPYSCFSSLSSVFPS